VDPLFSDFHIFFAVCQRGIKIKLSVCLCLCVCVSVCLCVCVSVCLCVCVTEIPTFDILRDMML
jgi:hypothetical protein